MIEDSRTSINISYVLLLCMHVKQQQSTPTRGHESRLQVDHGTRNADYSTALLLYYKTSPWTLLSQCDVPDRVDYFLHYKTLRPDSKLTSVNSEHRAPTATYASKKKTTSSSAVVAIQDEARVYEKQTEARNGTVDERRPSAIHRTQETTAQQQHVPHLGPGTKRRGGDLGL